MKVKVGDLTISLRNRYPALTVDNALSVQAIKEKLKNIIAECASEARGAIKLVVENLTTLHTQCLTSHDRHLIHKKKDALKVIDRSAHCSVPYTAFTKGIANTICATLDCSQRKDQAGFLKVFSTMCRLRPKPT